MMINLYSNIMHYASVSRPIAALLKTKADSAFFLIWPLHRAYESKASLIYFVCIQVM